MSQTVFPCKSIETYYSKVKHIVCGIQVHPLSHYQHINRCFGSAIFYICVCKYSPQGIFFFYIPFLTEQHGFRQNWSTITHLLVYCEFIVKSPEKKNKLTRSLYLDFSKAFDSVCLPMLVISKLANFGISGILLSWSHCYLSGRP